MCATFPLLALHVLLLCLNYNINQLQKKIYSDYTSLRELWRLIWMWYVCQALCLLLILASFKVNPRTTYDNIKKKKSKCGREKLWYVTLFFVFSLNMPMTYFQKTPGQETFQTIVNFKPIYYIRRKYHHSYWTDPWMSPHSLSVHPTGWNRNYNRNLSVLNGLMLITTDKDLYSGH